MATVCFSSSTPSHHVGGLRCAITLKVADSCHDMCATRVYFSHRPILNVICVLLVTFGFFIKITCASNFVPMTRVHHDGAF
jgi:hypothetical protein